MIAGRELTPAMPPLGLLVDRRVGERPEPADDPAVHRDHGRREDAAGGLVHERHELVGEAGHRAADADAADVRAAADACHPAALGDVAIDHWSPAADPHQALGRSVLVREVALLVVAGAVAALVHRLTEEPGR